MSTGLAPSPFTGYTEISTISNQKSSNLELSKFALTILYNAVILLLTIFRTLSIKRTLTRVKIQTPLLTLLLRDGTVYFATILGFNLLYLVAVIYQSNMGYSSEIGDMVTSIAISRLLLNLRGVYLKGSNTKQELTSFDVQSVNTLIGNLGAPLRSSLQRPRSYHEDDEEELQVYVSHDPLMEGFESLEDEQDDVADDPMSPVVSKRQTQIMI